MYLHVVHTLLFIHLCVVEVFEKVVSMLNQSDAALHAKLSLDKRAMVGIWFMATRESFRQLSQRFGISMSTAHKFVFDLVEALLNNLRTYIAFPTQFESVANRFYK